MTAESFSIVFVFLGMVNKEFKEVKEWKILN